MAANMVTLLPQLLINRLKNEIRIQMSSVHHTIFAHVGAGMSFGKVRGRQPVEDDQHQRDPRSQQLRRRMLTRAIIFLIAIILCASLFTYYSRREVGESSKPTPVGIARPSPTATLLIPTPTQALFYETFRDNRNFWALSNQDGFLREIVNGRLLLTNSNPLTTLVESLPSENRYSDFTLTITFTIQQSDANDSAGVYLRGDGTLDHDYRIDINGDNTFDIAKEYLDQQSMPQTLMLDGPRHTSALRPNGQLNSIVVTAQGPSMSVQINNMLVSSVADDDYTSGQIAFFVRHGATSPAASMSVSFVEVDRLDAGGSPS